MQSTTWGLDLNPPAAHCTSLGKNASAVKLHARYSRQRMGLDMNPPATHYTALGSDAMARTMETETARQNIDPGNESTCGTLHILGKKTVTEILDRTPNTKKWGLDVNPPAALYTSRGMAIHDQI